MTDLHVQLVHETLPCVSLSLQQLGLKQGEKNNQRTNVGFCKQNELWVQANTQMNLSPPVFILT